MTLYRKKLYDRPLLHGRSIYHPAQYWAVGEVREGKVGKIFRKRWADLSHCVPLTGDTTESLLLLNMMVQMRAAMMRAGMSIGEGVVVGQRIQNEARVHPCSSIEQRDRKHRETTYTSTSEHHSEPIRTLRYSFNIDSLLSPHMLPVYSASKSVIDQCLMDHALIASMETLKSSNPEDTGYSDVHALTQELLTRYAEEAVEYYRAGVVLQTAKSEVEEAEYARARTMLEKSDKSVREIKLGSIAALLKSILELSN